MVERVKRALSMEPATVGEIARLAGVSWEGARKALELLVKEGLAKRTTEGSKVFYSVGEDQDTYYRVPLPRQHKEALEQLFGIIKKVWEKENGTSPSPVFVQKAAVSVIKRLSLGLPVVRYIYGEITPLAYDPYRSYPSNPSLLGVERNELMGVIREVVREYGGLDFGSLLKIVYTTPGMELFRLKEEVKKHLHRGDILEAESGIFRMLVELDDREGREMLSEYLSLLQALGRDNPELFADLFNDVWEYVAKRLFLKDFLSFYGDVETPRLVSSIEEKKRELLDAFSALRELLSLKHQLRRSHPRPSGS